jgi:hypothetical protein
VAQRFNAAIKFFSFHHGPSSLLKNTGSYQGLASAMPKLQENDCAFRRWATAAEFFPQTR